MSDHYQTLGIPRTANADEIKRAYRKMAAQYHPDKGGDTEKFQEVQKAYSILSDPQSRAQYDNPQPQFNMNFGASGQEFNFESVFNIFNQTRFHQAHNQPRRTQLKLTLWLTIQDVFAGGRRPVSIGTPQGNIVAEIEIPQGVTDGETLQYPNIGPDGSDVIVTFRHHVNPQWKIDGANVITEHEVSIWDCILGKQVFIRGIQNETMMLTIPEKTNPGSILRMRGQGLPIRNGVGSRGDLLVKIKSSMPTHIPEELLNLIRFEQNI
jgi:curved DNA-binding protein